MTNYCQLLSNSFDRKLSKNDKFLTNKTKIYLFCYSFIFFLKLKLNFQLIVFISHVILLGNYLNETKKNDTALKKMKMSPICNMSQSDFLQF